MKKILIVIPTYNEKANISRLIKELFAQQSKLTEYQLQVLFVDDSSPDGTGNEIKKYQIHDSNIFLLEGKKDGLGIAYIRGYEYALTTVKPDIIVGLDADFSHDPAVIPKLVAKIEEGNDFVIGSRYVPGGSIPAEWSPLRKLNSKFGNLVARYVGGIQQLQDCTGAFRAIKADLLRKINLRYIGAKGYVFMVGLLHHAQRKRARFAEVPIAFRERAYGKSKLALNDIIEFIKYNIGLRLKSTPVSLYILFISGILGIGFTVLSFFFSLITVFALLLTLISTILIAMGISNLLLMIYAWEDAESVDENTSPSTFVKPHYSFTALVPARNEASVIGDTLQAIAEIQYPRSKMETIIICREDDEATIAAVNQKLMQLNNPNFSLLIFDDEPINKPHALNLGLSEARHDVVVVFDAEDEPHPEIYQVINTTFIKHEVDVVQSGVQLINHDTRWYSVFNVLEYFFWFKSSLHFFAKYGMVPLGGNTVFFLRQKLLAVGGWDEQCLTEDADIGIRLSAAGAKFRIVYDEKHVTLEETPATLADFIRQRTRWIQGFLQIFHKSDWLYLPLNKQRLFALYVLGVPILQLVTLLFLPFSILAALALKLSVVAALYTFIPLLLIIFQMIVLNVGYYEFTKNYNIRYSWFSPVKLFFLFLPYQLLLSASAIRAIFRQVIGEGAWEKTTHLNQHRTKTVLRLPMEPSYEYQV